MKDELISRMISGDRTAILKGLSCRGAIFRMNAIGQVYHHNMRDPEIIEKLMALKADDVMLDGCTVCFLDVSAINNFGIENYELFIRRLNELIESKFEFLSH